MVFPYSIELFGGTVRLHPHLLAEIVAYAGGMQLYLGLRRRARRIEGDRAVIPLEQNLWVIVGAVFGAVVGSKVLAWLEAGPAWWAHLGDLRAMIGGKTIVGGLLGGWIGVEVAKHFTGVTRRTGDLFVLPLAFGMAVGRVGCFLTGLDDHTYGVATGLPWGVDFGDGVRRHPTQIYEAVFLVLWGAAVLTWWKARGRPGAKAAGVRREGDAFRVFVFGYLAMRLAIEFIKPTWKGYAGLSAIQVASALGMVWCAWQLRGSESEAAMTEHPGPSTVHPGDRRWTEMQALEGWAGEVRLNMIRLAALFVFYGRHVLEYLSTGRGDAAWERFHLIVTAVIVVWAAAIGGMHWWLSTRRRLDGPAAYAPTVWDAAMVTALCWVGSGPRSPLVMLYFPLILAAALRLRLGLVWVATVLAAGGYLALMAHHAWGVVGWQKYYATPELRVPRAEQAIVLLSMGVTGLLTGQVVRQVRRIVHRYTDAADRRSDGV